MRDHLDILVGADVDPDSNSGAAGTVMATNDALTRMGHRVEAFWASDMRRSIAHGNLHYILELPWTYRRIVRNRLRVRTFDVVQLSQPHGYLAGRWILAQTSRPLMVWRSHGLEGKVADAMARYAPMRRSPVRAPLRAGAAALLRWAQWAAAKWSDGAVVPCSDDKAHLVEHFGASPERVRVIWHGVPDEFLDASPPERTPEHWQRILHVSQLSSNKNPEGMVEVASRVLRANAKASMTWVCPRELHSWLRDEFPRDIRDRLNLIGWIRREELMSLYDDHGIFLFATIAEGAAKVVMEAMARGMCVIATDTSGPRDYIQDRSNGRLVPVGDGFALADVATAFTMSPEGCAALGRAARLTASKFRWTRCASEMTSFYRALSEMRSLARTGQRNDG